MANAIRDSNGGTGDLSMNRAFSDAELREIPLPERQQLAIAAIQCGVSQRKACSFYHVNRATVANRMSGMKTRTEAHAKECAVTAAEEAVLVEFIKASQTEGFCAELKVDGLIQTLGYRGVPLTMNMITAYASRIAGKDLGETWCKRFKERHPELKVKVASSLEECRAKSLTPSVVHAYFKMLDEVISEYKIKPKNIYNMDEKGIQLGVAGRVQVVVDRDQKAVQTIASGNCELVTILECICATGEALNPSIVFQGLRRDNAWGQVNPCNASISLSPNGWTDQELGYLWLKKDFHPQSLLRLDDPEDYRLLILDGHNSHCHWDFVTFAKQHKIIVICLPSHTTHALQPCDVGVFGPLAVRWKAQVLTQTMAANVINKHNFIWNYSQARQLAFRKETIINAFRKCGIHPLNKEAIPKAMFTPAQNYTTQEAQPVQVSLPRLLVPVEPLSVSSTPSDDLSRTSDDPGTSEPPSSATSTDQTTLLSVPEDPVIASSASRTRAASVLSAASTGSEGSMQTDTQSSSVQSQRYRIDLPPILPSNASRDRMKNQIAALCQIAEEAGTELEKNHAQLVLMKSENKRLRQQLHNKKAKPRRAYNTGAPRLMTGDEMTDALLLDAQKKDMAILHAGLKTRLAEIKKALAKADKATKAAEKAAEKAAKAVKRSEAAAERGRGHGRGRGRGRGSRGSGGRTQADVESEAETEEVSEDEDEDSIEVINSPDNDNDVAGSSDSERDGDGNEQDTSVNGNGEQDTDAQTANNEEDDEDDEGELKVEGINGHRWFERKHLQFMVLWEDGEATWESLETVDDTVAMDQYLVRYNLEDPLQLPARKNVIDKALKATNE